MRGCSGSERYIDGRRGHEIVRVRLDQLGVDRSLGGNKHGVSLSSDTLSVCYLSSSLNFLQTLQRGHIVRARTNPCAKKWRFLVRLADARHRCALWWGDSTRTATGLRLLRSASCRAVHHHDVWDMHACFWVCASTSSLRYSLCGASGWELQSGNGSGQRSKQWLFVGIPELLANWA